VLGLTGFSYSQKVIITAHRGASGHAPENTLASFNKAIQLGTDFCELDAQETSDGVLIIVHDKNFKRTSGVDKNIWETSYAETKKIDAGSWYDKAFAGEKIPRLDEVINAVRGKAKLNIELKTNGHEVKLAERVVALITQMDFIDDCIITSFDHAMINKVKEMNPKIKAGYIFSKFPDFDVFTSKADLLSVNSSLVDKEFVEKAFKNGKEVHVWTVNDEKDMKKFIDLNVTSIITNYPDKVKEVLNSK
jgi:glycerophosphoryl diester phosphodiesterase